MSAAAARAKAHARRSADARPRGLRFPEPLGPRVVRHDVEVPGLDPSHDGVRVAHLTDLHVGLLTSERKVRRAVARANAEEPDVIVLTGDFLCYSPKFVGLLAEIASQIDGPAFAVLGNHDYWSDGEGARRALEASGIEVLKNQHTEIEIRNTPLQLVGIDDAVTAQADPARAMRGAKPGRSRVVLTHVPGIADVSSTYGPSLTLAGHTHGGHVNIPKITAGIARRLGSRYLSGFFRIGDTVLYVNRGVGSSSVPIRAGAPSEVAILTLRAAGPSEDDE